MNKLFFDDIRDIPDASWDLARDVPQAKELMKERPYDVMSLDHDIGFQMMCDFCNEHTQIMQERRELFHYGCPHMEHGSHLAQWMVENLTHWPKRIIVHSANPDGARRMILTLAEHKPRTEIVYMWYDKEKINARANRQF